MMYDDDDETERFARLDPNHPTIIRQQLQEQDDDGEERSSSSSSGQPPPPRMSIAAAVIVALLLLSCLVLVVIDSCTSKRVQTLSQAFFQWVEANPSMGVLAVILVYTLATSTYGFLTWDHEARVSLRAALALTIFLFRYALFFSSSLPLHTYSLFRSWIDFVPGYWFRIWGRIR